MADIYNMAGSSIWIGDPIEVPVSGELVLADFTAQPWLKISGWQTAGSVGDTAQVTTVTLLESARDRKSKGSKNAGSMENTFVPDATDPGQIRLTEAAGRDSNYAVRVIYSAGTERTSEVTISVASPAVIAWPGHGLTEGSIVRFTTTGSLPTGLLVDTDYYVVETITSGSFSVSTTPGGAALDTTLAGSGTSSATGTPAGRIRLFGALVMGVPDQGGDANATQMFTSTLEINSNILRL